MRRLLRLILNNPIATVIIVVFMAFAGVYSAKHMSIDLFPNLDIPVVNIITHYPAASPEDIEKLITRPIEDEIRNIPGVKRVSSISLEGISKITAEFRWGTTIRDARQLVQSKLAQIGNLLPAGLTPHLESIGTTLQEVCGYIIYGGSDMITLRNIVQYDLTGYLMSVDGVSYVEVLGGYKRAFYVKIKIEKLIFLHLTINDIVSVLKHNNVSTVAGYLDQGGKEYIIRGDALTKTIEDIRNLPLLNHGSEKILLGDIADVFEGYAPKHYTVHGNTVPAVAMIVKKQPGASTISVVRDVDKTISQLRSLLPSGTHIKKFYDQSEIIKESQNEINNDLLIGAILAVFVLYFFIGSIKPTLIVALTIPLTFLSTITIMKLLGISFNIITMTALTLSIGMIVDDSIVVAENIFRHAQSSSKTDDIIIEGTLEIAGPDTTGTFTTIAAFLPLVLISGFVSIFMRPFALTISAAILISLLLSLTLIPTLFGSMKKAYFNRNNFVGVRLLKQLDKILQKVLRLSFRHKLFVLSLALFFFVMAGLTLLFDRVSFLPPIDEGAILIEYIMPPGTSLKESNRIGDILDKIALKDRDVSCVYRRTGSPGNGFQIEGVNRGELLIKLKHKGKRIRSVEEIIQTFKKSYSKLKGIVFLYHQPTQEKIDESFSGLPAIFGVTIFGTNMHKLVEIADKVENILSTESGISNIVNNTKIKVPEINIHINYSALAQYGVDVTTVLDTLQSIRFGFEATRIIREKEEVAIFVKSDLNKSLDIKNIRQLPIETVNGNWVPLEYIAEIKINYVTPNITRWNGQREITILAEVEGNIRSLINRLQQRFRTINLPKGYRIDFSGQYHMIIKTAIEMFLIIISAILLIYLIMVMQFGSWIQPFIILVTIPLTLASALLGLFLTQEGIDISVGMGMVTLVGIAVNNAVVLIDFANRERAYGKNITEALLSASSVRLRPILLTSLTTIAALLPTAIGTTVGSSLFQPFAITLISGLVGGIVATLIVIPIILEYQYSTSDNKMIRT